LVFGQSHDCGIRSICWFLELTQLDTFIASSYGSQQKVASQVEQLLGQFGHEEDRRLGQQMPPKAITLCEDETFHPQICLVAIEPVSNFLILEAYAEKRDAATWNKAIDSALEPFSVDVIQCVSDEATALLSHAQSHLGVHHSSDVFHVQYEVSKATSLPLNRQNEKTKEAFDLIRAEYQENKAQRLAFRKVWPSSIRELELEKELRAKARELVGKLRQAKQQFETTNDRRQRARDARCRISSDYHPFDILTGQPLESSEVEQRLTQHFETLHTIAQQASLSQGSNDRISKAQRVLPSMIATILFFWSTLKLLMEKLDCCDEVKQIWKNEVVASYYLAQVANRSQNAKESKRLRDLSESILARARSPDRAWSQLPESMQEALAHKAREAADVFQRSSSCVEGRNGQLSLRHHGLRELSSSKLRALRTIHNYVIHRSDKTTSAERFFEIKPRDVMGWLLEQLPMPARPRPNRKQAS
jgi:hypothetical protein